MTAPPPGPEPDAEVMRALVEAQDLCARLAAERSAANTAADRARQRASEVEDSIAFGLGSALLNAIRSLQGALALPGALLALVRHWRARGRGAPQRPATVGGEPSTHAPVSAAPELPGAQRVRAWYLQRRPPPPQTLSEFRVAAVLDPFTCAGLAPDCRLLNVSGAEIERQIDGFRPHVLFVESAWRGQDGHWTHKVSPCSSELVQLAELCRRRAIPTVFWCKEDPSHFEDFVAAAALFDYVFTTDSDCVERYRARLGHRRVGVLGFACQPRIHNPVEIAPRRVAASFAGSWYTKYPERARDFESLLESVQPVLPVEIYDRNHDRGDAAFEYPSKYRPLVRDGVPYARIGEVYKACEFAITVNTITASPTMFARRTHELLASNTITISNRCAGVDRAFGDKVVMAGRDDIGERLAHLRDSQDARHRLRLRGLREVMTQHTAALRLSQVAAVSVGSLAPVGPAVWVLARVQSREQFDDVVTMYRVQRQLRKQLLMLVPSAIELPHVLPEGVRTLAGADADAPITQLIPAGDWIAPWHVDDYYGACYLLDLMLATAYADAPAVGKATRFAMVSGAPKLQPGAAPYSRDAQLRLRSSVARAALLGNSCLREVLDSLDGEAEMPLRGLAVDEFGYCFLGAGRESAFAVDVD